MEEEIKTELTNNQEPTETVEKPEKPALKTNKAALVAAVLGIVSAALFIAFSVFFFVGITNFDSNNVPDDKKASAAFAAIFVIILFMVPITASGVVAALFELGRSIVYFTQVSGKRKSNVGILILFTLLKVVYGVVVGYGALIFASFGDFINPIFLYIGTGAGVVAIICSLVGIPFGFISRQRAFDAD